MPLLSLATTLPAAPRPPEQVAFDYFTSEVLKTRYQKANRIYLTGKVEAQRTIAGPFPKCFSDYTFLYRERPTASEPIQLTYSKRVFRQTTSPKKHGLNLVIYSSVLEGNVFYTYVKIYKPHHFTDHYLITSSATDGKVTGVCQRQEVM